MKLSHWVWALTSAVLVGCGGASTAPKGSPAATARATDRPRIGVPCQLSSAASSPAATAEPVRVFVEVATVRGDLNEVLRGAPPVPSSTAATFAELLRDPRLEMPRVGHFLVANDASQTIAWDSEKPSATGRCDEANRWDLTLTAHADGERPASVRLEVSLAPAPPLGTPPESWQIPEHRRIHTTVVVKDQQTVVLGGVAEPGAPSSSRSILLMTPYVVREQSDLKRLFECKQRQAS
jgi:hypothetical protein